MKVLLAWSIPTAIGLILIVLRAAEVIDWSWWMVLIPFWVPVILYTLAVIILVLWYLVTGGSKNK